MRTPQTEGYQFLNARKSQTDVDTSDSDHTKLDSCKSSPPRPKSPRPRTLPGVSDGVTGTPKKIPPRGSDIPGMPGTAKSAWPSCRQILCKQYCGGSSVTDGKGGV